MLILFLLISQIRLKYLESVSSGKLLFANNSLTLDQCLF